MVAWSSITFFVPRAAASSQGRSASAQGVDTMRSFSPSWAPRAPGIRYPTESTSRTRALIPGAIWISAAPSPGMNLGWVVMMVLPEPDWGSSSISRSRLGPFAIMGSTIFSIRPAMNVLFPVRTGPTTPRYKSPCVRSAISR